jgi:hypothetical protein
MQAFSVLAALDNRVGESKLLSAKADLLHSFFAFGIYFFTFSKVALTISFTISAENT